MFISYDEIKAIDNKYLSIPLIRQYELSIFLKMTNECKKMSEISKCYTGEVDISLHSEFITNPSSDHSMLRGAQVQKYYITNDISQGNILFLKADGYLNKNKGEKSQHHNRRRIVMQKKVLKVGLFSKKTVTKTYDKKNKKPIIKASICNGEQVAGFKDIHTGKIEEVMLIKNQADLDAFKKMYGIDGEIEKEY